MEEEFIFYRIWGITCEGRSVHSTYRFLENTTRSEAMDIMHNNFRGGVGDDWSEFTSVEETGDDGIWFDCSYLQK